jgi:hypothetical protein
MKKIITAEEKAKKTRINQLVIGLILIVVMLFSTLGYAFSDKSKTSSTSIKYKGIEFNQNSGYWVFNLNGKQFSTFNNPVEVENISFSIKNLLANYEDKPLYFSGNSQSLYEITRNLNQFTERIQEACLIGENCSANLPVKDCLTDNIIIIRENSENQKENVYQQDNCVFISASYENQTKYSDAFLLKILGI